MVYLADPHGSGLFDAVHAHLKGEKVGVDGTDVHGEPVTFYNVHTRSNRLNKIPARGHR